MSAEANTATKSSSRSRAISRLLVPSALLILSANGCGVQDHARGGATPLNSSNDFGPSTGIVPGAGGALVQGAGGSFVNGAGGAPPSSPGGVPGSSGGFPDISGAGGTSPAVGGGPPAAGGTLSSSGGTPAVGTGGALSGVTITLGTNTVAKENAIAFIHFGHSNMAGRAIDPSATRPYFFTQTDPHAWMYHVGTPPQPALEPYTADDDTSGLYGGPGTAIVKEAAALAPGTHFISLGFGKESAYCSQFLPGALYYTSLSQAAIAIKDRVTFGAIIIMLGITERHGTAADVTGYSTCINTLVTAIRTDIGRPDLPLLLTDYEQEATGDLAIDQPFAQSIIPEIHKVPMVVSNSALVPTDGLGMQDDHHFNFDGHKLWVQRALQIMKDKGWFPWGT